MDARSIAQLISQKMNTQCPKLHEALDEYSASYYKLKAIIDEHPKLFPSSVVSCGTFAEFYSIVYLRHVFPDADITFGHGSQKGWDIRVHLPNGQRVLYQVKSLSGFAKTRVIARPIRGFDILLVLVLDADFYLSTAYLFEGNETIKLLVGSSGLTVPDTGNPRRPGSVVFRMSRDISSEMHNALAENF